MKAKDINDLPKGEQLVELLGSMDEVSITLENLLKHGKQSIRSILDKRPSLWELLPPQCILNVGEADLLLSAYRGELPVEIQPALAGFTSSDVVHLLKTHPKVLEWDCIRNVGINFLDWKDIQELIKHRVEVVRDVLYYMENSGYEVGCYNAYRRHIEDTFRLDIPRELLDELVALGEGDKLPLMAEGYLVDTKEFPDEVFLLSVLSKTFADAVDFSKVDINIVTSKLIRFDEFTPMFDRNLFSPDNVRSLLKANSRFLDINGPEWVVSYLVADIARTTPELVPYLYKPKLLPEHGYPLTKDHPLL